MRERGEESLRPGAWRRERPEINFVNMLTRSLYARRSQKRKKIQLSHKYLFTLFGSTGAKAVRRTLTKLTPGINFVNMLTRSLYKLKSSSPQLLFH